MAKRQQSPFTLDMPSRRLSTPADQATSDADPSPPSRVPLATPSSPCATAEPSAADQSSAARTYWIDRARNVHRSAAVLPGGRWLRYHDWTHRMLQRWTLSRLDRPRFRRFVDLGCGRGEWSSLFAPRVDEVFACDVADAFVVETRGRLTAAGHGAYDVEVADIADYRIPSGVDLAYLGGVLTYLRDDVARDVLHHLRQACVTNALVIVRDYCTFNLGRRSVESASGFSIHRRPADLVALAEAAGLRCAEVRASPVIYAEAMGNALTRWPLRMAWRLATLHWARASHSFVFHA